MIVYRIQDAEGRGPFRPGFTQMWKGDDGLDLPPIYAELGIDPTKLAEIIPAGMFAGIGCSSMTQLHRWFNRNERRRLHRMGYYLVIFEPTQILRETLTQVLFAHNLPLATICSLPQSVYAPEAQTP